uniref:Putative secreted protein n=1 Tax=Ixodes ricinus TaxID=34613 RepID=A0A6B0TZT1_IXORI
MPAFFFSTVFFTSYARTLPTIPSSLTPHVSSHHTSTKSTAMYHILCSNSLLYDTVHQHCQACFLLF